MPALAPHPPEPIPAVLKPRGKPTVRLLASEQVFGVPYFHGVTGNWSEKFKMGPVSQDIKKLGKLVFVEQKKNLNPRINKFEDHGEYIVQATYRRFCHHLADAKMPDEYRNVIIAMLSATENSKRDEKHQMWLFKWSMNQAKKRNAKRKADRIDGEVEDSSSTKRLRTIPTAAKTTSTKIYSSGERELKKPLSVAESTNILLIA
ncbi:hypothetical protein Dda_5647 [Drechslerella dactyloides]|uniref:Uncharacterized protein n=1 Tax=Drechslerella dactyloides TaxID=74499 RepID=A0AAD6NJ19_DREDA|nr:hypothetical protein Dda_5647 [Drechslerella dactyloides]